MTPMQTDQSPLRIDFTNQRVVYVGGKSVILTERMYDIFQLLHSRRGEIVTREDISHITVVNVDAFVNMLKNDLIRQAGINPIETIVGKGYRLSK